MAVTWDPLCSHSCLSEAIAEISQRFNGGSLGNCIAAQQGAQVNKLNDMRCHTSHIRKRIDKSNALRRRNNEYLSLSSAVIPPTKSWLAPRRDRPTKPHMRSSTALEAHQKTQKHKDAVASKIKDGIVRKTAVAEISRGRVRLLKLHLCTTCDKDGTSSPLLASPSVRQSKLRGVNVTKATADSDARLPSTS